MTLLKYREWLIEYIIIKSNHKFTRERLQNKSTISLEIIFDSLCI